MRSTRALIHLDNLARNIRALRNWTAEHAPASPPMLCLAVKADAYGHGIEEVAATAVAEGVEYLAVATVDEAVQLRHAGIELPLLLYSLPNPTELEEIVAHRLTPLVGDAHLAETLNQECRRQGATIDIHLKVDTGMGRIGCPPSETGRLAKSAQSLPGVRLRGVSTHFAAADDRDPALTRTQLQRFERALEAIRAEGIDPGVIHAANSGAVLQYPESYYHMVRPGLAAYGYYPSQEMDRPLELRPVMELRSRIVFLKEVPAGTTISYGATYRTERRTWIGTIPCGYGDGYNRLLSNSGTVLAGGRRLPIVGRVCMDQLMVDCGSTPPELYAEVSLFGPDAGGPDAAELAGLCGTIPYEITCNISKRVPRIYSRDSSAQSRAR